MGYLLSATVDLQHNEVEYRLRKMFCFKQLRNIIDQRLKISFFLVSCVVLLLHGAGVGDLGLGTQRF